MTDNELDKLASQAGFAVNMVGQIVTPAPSEDARQPLRRFAALLLAAERERCAKLCDLHSRLTWNDDRKAQSRVLADEIRRGA